ncbi:MAG: class I SAM-dependent methyltransferase [Candidatus Nanopelagicales bacterium]
MSDDSREIYEVFDLVSEEYDQVGVAFFQPIAEALVKAVAPTPGDCALDVGCGRGAVTLRLAELVGPSGRVTSTDLAEGMVQRLRADIDARNVTNVTVEIGDAQRPDFAAESFDIVTGGLVVFMLADPEEAVATYFRLLASGGSLGFTTFGAQDEVFEAAMKAIADFLPAQEGETGPMEPGPVSTIEGIADVLGIAGFTDIRTNEVTVVSNFEDLDHWERWLHSHGARVLIEALPADRRRAAIEAGREVVSKANGGDGTFRFTTVVRVSTARRP